MDAVADLLAVPNLWVTLIVTVVVVGFGALSTGQALARGWQPIWQVWIYCVLLGAVDRFLIWGLFSGEPLDVTAYVIDTAFLTAVATMGYMATRAGKMVAQYPWLYERSGPFGWREKTGAAEPGNESS